MSALVRGLGRRKPQDWEHVEKYPYSNFQPETITIVEKILTLPPWHWTHDQGREGSCVGHGASMERAIMNIAQGTAEEPPGTSRRYNPLWLWDRAKEVDRWEDTNPGDDNGTSVRAAYRILRQQGHQPCYSMRLGDDGKPYPIGIKPISRSEGVRGRNRWAKTVDEMRTAIWEGRPVTIGVNWYSRFYEPDLRGYQEWWIAGDHDDFGTIRGGHCVCVYGASDRLGAFKVKNSWGQDYPLAWIGYGAMQRLLDEYGEATLQTDR